MESVFPVDFFIHPLKRLSIFPSLPTSLLSLFFRTSGSSFHDKPQSFPFVVLRLDIAIAIEELFSEKPEFPF
jgi:hypothetical protein